MIKNNLKNVNKIFLAKKTHFTLFCVSHHETIFPDGGNWNQPAGILDLVGIAKIRQ